MTIHPAHSPQTLLVIDDMERIHDDFRKIFVEDPEIAALESSLDETARLFFDGEDTARSSPAISFELEVDSALQGEDGVEMMRRSLATKDPYKVAFVDMRMPPGIDGLETIERLWDIDPRLQIVICTAYSDHSWPEICERVGQRDNLLVLKKPFDTIEVQQMATALICKWNEHASYARELEAASQREERLAVRGAKVSVLAGRLRACADAIATRLELAKASPQDTRELRSQLADFHDYTRVINGQDVLDVEPFNLAGLGHHVVGGLLEDEISLSLCLDPSLPEQVGGDEIRIHRVIEAMVADVHFRSGGEHIRLSILNAGRLGRVQQVEITVRTSRSISLPEDGEDLRIPDLLALLIGGVMEQDEDGARMVLPLNAHLPHDLDLAG